MLLKYKIQNLQDKKNPQTLLFFRGDSEISKISETAKSDVTPRQDPLDIPALGWSHGIGKGRIFIALEPEHNKIKADDWSLNLNYLCSVSGRGLSVEKELWYVHGFSPLF